MAGTTRTTYVVQTYVAGARGSLRIGVQIACTSEQNGRIRVKKLMAAGSVLGVDLVKQIADPEAGEYGEPEYLVRAGRVPELG